MHILHIHIESKNTYEYIHTYTPRKNRWVQISVYVYTHRITKCICIHLHIHAKTREALLENSQDETQNLKKRDFGSSRGSDFQTELGTAFLQGRFENKFVRVAAFPD